MKWKDEEKSNKMEEHHAYTAPILDIYKKIPFPYPTVIIGAGGFGREVAEIARRMYLSSRSIKIIGFIDNDKKLHGNEINNYKVLGDLKTFDHSRFYFICSIANPIIKRRIIEQGNELQYRWINIIDPKIEPFYGCKLGKGIVIQKGTCLAVNSIIEDHVHINFNCSIGHDARIGKYSTISPLCAISGNTTIGECCFLGSGVITFPGVKIGANSKIGAGSVVTKNIPPNVVAIGSPARIVKRLG